MSVLTIGLAVTDPSLWTRVGISLLQVAALALGGPLLLGMMGKIRARVEGRVGPPVTQGLADLMKLLRKEAIRSEHMSALGAMAPLVLAGSAGMAAAITPLLTTHPVDSGGADVFVVVYLLLMGSVAIALGGLDAGTAFGGMGSSRAMTIGAISEPALLVGIIALAAQAHTSNLPGIVAASLSHPGWLVSPQRLMALAALVVVVIAETGRLPVDNPFTHLELTMIHEAMILEYSGPDLALVTMGEAMRLGLLFGLLGNLFIPWGIDTSNSATSILVALAALCAKSAAIGSAIALMEVSTAKLRLFRVPELLAGAFVLATVAVTTGLVVK